MEEFYIEGDPISEVKQSSHTDKSLHQADGFTVNIQKGLHQLALALN